MSDERRVDEGSPDANRDDEAETQARLQSLFDATADSGDSEVLARLSEFAQHVPEHGRGANSVAPARATLALADGTASEGRTAVEVGLVGGRAYRWSEAGFTFDAGPGDGGVQLSFAGEVK